MPESELAVAAGGGFGSPGSQAGLLGAYRPLRGLGATPLLVAILGPFVALAVGFVPRMLLAVVILDIPFQFGTHLYYREDEAALGALGGWSISATTIALAGLYTSWLIRVLANRNHQTRPSLHINLPLMLYLAIATLSVLVAQDVSLSLFEVSLLFEACLVYIYVANSVRTRKDLMFVVWLLLIGCLVESAAMIVLRFTGMPSTIWGLPTHIHLDPGARAGYVRIGGTVGSPNTAAAYLSLLLVPAASLLLAGIGRVQKWLATAVLGLGAVALIFTFSRGGWIAFAVSIASLSLFAWRRSGLSLAAPLAVLLILALLYLPFHGAISERLFGDDRGSAQSRIPLMKLAYRIFEDNPVLGVGSNNFTVIMDRYLTSEFRRGFLYAVHNKYLLVLSETGIAGLLAFLAFLLGTLRKGWVCTRLKDRLLSPLALGFTVALAGHMVQMGVDVFRGRPVQQLLWLVAGLLAAMHRMRPLPSSSDPLSGIT